MNVEKKIKMKLIVFCICVTLIDSMKPVISEECMTPTQVAGTCIDIKDCPLLVSLLRIEGAKAANFVTKFNCHFEGKTPIVCCPNDPGDAIEHNLYGPLLPPQCGFTNVSHTKIVGGVPAKLNAWPWLAALGYKNNTNSSIIWDCGGTLISVRHILTAAHCAIRKDLYVIRLGELNLVRDDDGAHPIDVGFERKIIHPEYNQKSRNDIAVVRLDRDIQFTYEIHPICLPIGSIRHLNFVNTHPFLAGWGDLDFGGPRSNVSMEVQVPVVTTEACAEANKHETIDDSLICTGGEGDKDSCQGDSGGPVMLPINGSFYELGVIVTGVGCAVPGYPSLNSRVTTYLHFIISNLQ